MTGARYRLPQFKQFEFSPPAVWSSTDIPTTPLPAYTESEKREPVRAMALEPDVLVPAAKAVISGFACSFITGLVSIWQRWPWYWTMASLVGGAGLGWFWFIAGSGKLLWRVEKVVNRDLDNDNTIGEPERIEPQRLHIEIKQDNHTDYLDVPRDKVAAFAKAVLSGGSMSESSWKRHFGGVKEYREFRDRLMQAGVVRWINTNAKAQGLELTKRGKRVIEELANL